MTGRTSSLSPYKGVPHPPGARPLMNPLDYMYMSPVTLIIAINSRQTSSLVTVTYSVPVSDAYFKNIFKSLQSESTSTKLPLMMMTVKSILFKFYSCKLIFIYNILF